MTLDEFRIRRDRFGLERYAESFHAHKARLAEIAEQLPRQNRRHQRRRDELAASHWKIPDWEYSLRHKWLNADIRQQRSALRGQIAYERGEMQRVAHLYHELSSQMRERKTA